MWTVGSIVNLPEKAFSGHLPHKSGPMESMYQRGAFVPLSNASSSQLMNVNFFIFAEEWKLYDSAPGVDLNIGAATSIELSFVNPCGIALLDVAQGSMSSLLVTEIAKSS